MPNKDYYQAFIFVDGKRVQTASLYATKEGIIYRLFVIGEGGFQVMHQTTTLNENQAYWYVSATPESNFKQKKIEEIMCATFDCDDENTPYEYTNGLKRYIYLDGDTHNYNLNNMKSCDFWEYLEWAHDNGVYVKLTKMNELQILDRFSQDGLSMYAFSKKYRIPYSTVWRIITKGV